MNDDEQTPQGDLEFRATHSRALFDYGMDAVFLARPDGSIISANPAACTLFGMSEAALQEAGRAAILDENDPALLAMVAERTKKGSARGEVKARRADGTGFIAEISSVIFLNGKGEYLTSATVRDVTARKLADDKLRWRDRLLSMTSRIARVGGWEADMRSLRVAWSDEVCRIHGVEPGTVMPLEDAFQFYVPEHRERIRTAFMACTRDGLAYDEDFVIVTTAGERRHVRSIGEAVRDAAGNITRIQGALQDITELKRAETRLVRARERFQQFADAMPLIVWTAKADGTVDYANNAFSQFGSTDRDELLARHWQDAIHPDDRERCRAAWQEAVEAGTRYAVEVRCLTPGNTGGRWHIISAEPIRDEGRIVRWYGTAIDIHERKLSQKAAAESAERLQTTLENITDGFMMLDHDWRFTYVNGEAERLLRGKRERLLGRNVWTEYPDAVGMSFERGYRQAVETQQAVHFEAHYPPLGIWVEAHAYPTSDGVAVYLRDVTERRALEEQLRQSQRLEAVGQLTGGVAHDFNNLLTVILGGADALSEKLTPDSPLHELALVIRTAAEQGSALTRRLLAFGRRQPLSPRIVNINQLIAGMDDLLRRTLSETIDIDIQTMPELWSALIDATELQAALLNLCLNACDAMGQDGCLTIETANARLDGAYADQHKGVTPGEYVLLAVSDTGTGIAANHLEKVFDPFFTTKEKGKGTGLGLSMVYGFVKQSRGHIKIYSEPGQGTTVKLYLPRANHAADASQSVADAAIDTPSEVSGSVVLVVEDDDLVRRHAETLLIDLGYEVVAAGDGPGALELIRARPDIDLLFTDVIMPGMNGRELAEAARKLRPALAILFTSGYTENAIVHHGRLDKGVHLLQKPYRKAELDRKLRDILPQTAVCN
ncbi:MAG TPA: PAS domain S-box protein [Gammaproteobacteria bacterium]|nr:PAS domain S-box protein [Gammaproteobacteria bacterium]